MSDVTTVVTVLLLCAAANVSPGPNFALISRMAMSGRTSRAWGAAFGMAAAGTLYGILAMMGLSIVLQEIGWLSCTVQIAGGLYLVWLGLSSWRSAAAPPEPAQGSTAVPGASKGREFRGGLRIGTIVDLANPKNIAFYVSLFAVAVPHGTATWAKASILGGAFVLELCWYAVIIALLSTDRARRVYGRCASWIEKAIGGFLILLGGRMISDR